MSGLVTDWITSKVKASRVEAAKTVYPVVRTGMGADSVTDQGQHAPIKQPAKPAQSDVDPEQRALKLAGFARAIQQERNCDWTRAWIQASQEHPELINSDSDGGPSKTLSAQRTVLPGTDETAVTATFKELPNAKW